MNYVRNAVTGGGEAADSLKDIHLDEPSSSDILGQITAKEFT